MKKQILSVLLSLTVVLSVIFSPMIVTAAAGDPGDVDGNGKLEISDATLIQRFLAKMQTLDEDALQRANVSGGDKLSVIDVTLIQRRLAKMIPCFPVENKITKVKDVITIRFTDKKKWGKVYARVFNYVTGEANAEAPGVQLTDPVVTAEGYNEYKMDVDVSKYDRVVFSNGAGKTSIEAPVTKASYGYFISDKNATKYDLDIYTGDSFNNGEIVTVKMDYPGYPEGEQKTVWIYLPDGYDPEDTDKKYSVLYMDDGQVMLGTLPNDDWRCDKTVRSLMNNGGDGMIIVGISSLEGDRDQEMRPYIGEPVVDPEWVAQMREKLTEDEFNELYREMLGEYKEYCKGGVFADFTVNTVIPYVESHYNVNTVRGFTGSSGGGLEAFYIGMEYPELFDYVGVMSPSLNVYDASVWNDYLDTKDFSGKVPRMYFFCGNHPKDVIEQELYPYSTAAEGWLLAHNYPADRVRTVTNDSSKHLHKYWGLYLPELFSWGLEL